MLGSRGSGAMVKNGKRIVIRGSCHGSCLCGAVSFELSGAASPPNSCHCAMCRRWHGALGVYTSTANRDFTLHGEEHLRWYRSSPSSERGFCGQCGASLFWRQVDGDSIDVTMGSLNNGTGLRLAKHIWVNHRGDYYRVGDDLPQYPASSAHAQPIAAVTPPVQAPQPDPHTGNCLCGAIHFTIRGPMRDISVCHCRQCLRWHGHPPEYSKAAWAQIDLTGAEHVLWYSSSETARRGSCRICGSSLFWELHGNDAVSIAAGALNPPTGLKIVRHIFVEGREDYCNIADDTPRFAGTGAAANT